MTDQPTKTRPGDQPLPTGGQQCVQDALIAKIEERKQLGVQRYGSVLMTHNGRDAGQDMVEEAVDLAVYSMQVAMELRDLRATVEQYQHLRAVAGIHCSALGNLLHDAGIRMPDSALRMYLLLQDELTLTLNALARQRPALFREADKSADNSGPTIPDHQVNEAESPDTQPDNPGGPPGLRERLAAALDTAFADNYRPGEGFPADDMGEAALTALTEYLDIGEAEAWCKTCRRVWNGKDHRCEGDAEQRLAEVITTLDDVLRHFVHKGHPGEPCLQTGWISERTVARWRAVLYPPKEA